MGPFPKWPFTSWLSNQWGDPITTCDRDRGHLHRHSSTYVATLQQMGAKKQWQEAGRLGCLRVEWGKDFCFWMLRELMLRGYRLCFLVGVTGIYFLGGCGGVAENGCGAWV